MNTFDEHLVSLTSLTNMPAVTTAKSQHSGESLVGNEASTFLIRTFPLSLGIQQSNASLMSNERKMENDFFAVTTYV